MKDPNTIVISDSEYLMSAAYLAGARAMRAETTWHANPHRYGSEAHDDWSYGHTHEAAGEHIRSGRDLIAEAATGKEFQEDPTVPRDARGEVDLSWYTDQLAALAAT